MINKMDSKSNYPLIRGRIEQAEYNAKEVDDYIGNPLVESLPMIWSDAEVSELLLDYPKYKPEDRNKPKHIRYHLLGKLYRFFTVVKKHLELERDVSWIIRQGYLDRNPTNIDYWSNIKAGIQKIASIQEGKPELRYQPNLGFAIIGISGIGKTRGVIQILTRYPQVIYHETFMGKPFNRIQIVWLFLVCPHDGTLKSLCIDFFRKVDALIGTDYFGAYVKPKATIEDLTMDMAIVAAVHCIGVLVIDEIQHMSVAKSGGLEKMLNFFSNLDNELGIPVIPIGTYRCEDYLVGNLRQARRFSGVGDFYWDRMLPKNDANSEDGDWELFLPALWSYQYTKSETELTDDLKKALFEVSQGITDIAIKAYILAQVRAMNSSESKSTGIEIITPNTIFSAANDGFRLLSPTLNAIKRGERDALDKFDDIFPHFKNYFQVTIDSNLTHNTNLTDPTTAASTGENTSKESKSAPNTPNPCDHKSEINSNPKNPGSSKKKKKRAEIIEGSLMQIGKDGKDQGLSYHDALKQSGYVKNASEFIE